MFSVLSVYRGHYVDTSQWTPYYMDLFKLIQLLTPSPTIYCCIGKWAVGLRMQGLSCQACAHIKPKHNIKNSLSVHCNFSLKVILCRRNFTSIKSFVRKRKWHLLVAINKVRFEKFIKDMRNIYRCNYCYNNVSKYLRHYDNVIILIQYTIDALIHIRINYRHTNQCFYANDDDIQW